MSSLANAPGSRHSAPHSIPLDTNSLVNDRLDFPPTADLSAAELHCGWLRDCTTVTVIDRAMQALHDGAREEDLWAAVALTACYHVNNQAHNLLGFVSHALIAVEDARRLASGQPRDIRLLLLMQALYQIAFDLNDPCLSPYELLPVKGFADKSAVDNIRNLRTDMRFGEYLRADHRLVALEKELPRAALIDLLLEIGAEGMVTDDHTLISPVLCLGLCELVGWKHGFNMLRCALRYSASFPRNFAPYDRALELLNQYGLNDGAPEVAYQADHVEPLRRAFHAAVPAERPEIVARAMAHNHLSPATVLSAVTLTAADLYLMTDGVPHSDFDAVSREVAPIHIGTSTNALRAALRLASPRTAALLAISGGNLLERGPSVLNATFEFVPFAPISNPYPRAEKVATLLTYSRDTLLQAVHTAAYAHNYCDMTAAIRAYQQHNGDPAALIATLTSIAATDDGTILHALKHLNAMVKEFHVSTHPERWNYLMAAGRFAAWYAGVSTTAYARTRMHLDPLSASLMS